MTFFECLPSCVTRKTNAVAPNAYRASKLFPSPSSSLEPDDKPTTKKAQGYPAGPGRFVIGKKASRPTVSHKMAVTATKVSQLFPECSSRSLTPDGQSLLPAKSRGYPGGPGRPVTRKH